jgi:hypothetical protein
MGIAVELAMLDVSMLSSLGGPLALNAAAAVARAAAAPASAVTASVEFACDDDHSFLGGVAMLNISGSALSSSFSLEDASRL